MCLPHPPEAAAPAVNTPSMDAASALNSPGVPRGAALLGRLKLRLDGSQPSAAPAPAKAAPAKAAPLSESAGFSTGPAQAPANQYNYAFSPNSDLRLPLI